jgi:hypothetical protein
MLNAKLPVSALPAGLKYNLSVIVKSFIVAVDNFALSVPDKVGGFLLAENPNNDILIYDDILI